MYLDLFSGVMAPKTCVPGYRSELGDQQNTTLLVRLILAVYA